jgi:RNA polymerase sigma factor (sigma-70 family)
MGFLPGRRQVLSARPLWRDVLMIHNPLDPVVGHVRRLAAQKNGPGPSDSQLLRRFVGRRDEAAFAVLVRRHERLVWRVCWRALGHVQDAEDAFQATFVVLAHSAASIRSHDALASWLHGVALRVTSKAKRAAARRRKHEREAMNMPRKKRDCELSLREVCQVLDEEVGRLPEKYRAPFVLCVLEGHSLAEAARRLGWKEGTVSGRLTVARKQLQERLGHREIRLSAVLAGLSLAGSAANASPPAGLAAQAIGAALSCTARPEAAANVLSTRVATLVQGATKPMLTPQMKFAAVTFFALNCMIAGVGLIAREQVDAPQAPPAATSSAPAAKPVANEEPAALALSGRVLDPAGQPVKSARLYLLDFSPAKGPPRVQATSGADGRFHFSIARKDIELPPYSRGRWDHVSLCAAAEGHGLALHPLKKPQATKEVELRLARDDMPIRGRVLDLQGKPLAGATARLIGLSLPNKGDLSAFAEALDTSKDGYPVENRLLTSLDSPAVAQLFPTARADETGRFQLRGVGRERMAILEVSGPTIETRHVRVMTRPGERVQLPEWHDFPHCGKLTYYGASFTHVAGPTTPITGVVRDKDTRKPLAGAVVTSWKLPGDSLNGRTFIRTIADRKGRYRLVGMPRGEGGVIDVLGPEGEPYLDVKLGVPAVQGFETVSVDAELKRGVWIKGRVTDRATGRPVPAHIDYFAFRDNPYRHDAPGFEPRLPTGDDGTFQFIGLPGRGLIGARAMEDKYLVAVGSEKFAPRKDVFRTIATSPPCMSVNYHTLVEVEAARGATSATCAITVDPGRTLTGTVLDPNGKPLAGARMGGVTGFSISSWEYQTQPTASFTVHAVKKGEKRNILVLHEARRLAGSRMIRGDEEGPLTIRLESWGVLRGRLVTADGQPRAGAEVTLYRFGDRIKDPTCGYPTERSYWTDREGRFRIEALVPGLKYTMHFLNKGRLRGAIFEDLTVESGEKNLADVQVKE